MNTIDKYGPFYPTLYIIYVLILAPVSSALRRSYWRDAAWINGNKDTGYAAAPKGLRAEARRAHTKGS